MKLIAGPPAGATARVIACQLRDLERLQSTHLTRTGFKARIGEFVVISGPATVGRVSAHPPRLLELTYMPDPSPAPRRRLALVGKGITYDSGGLSLKEPAQLIDMKADMAGAAAVVGAFDAISRVGTDLEIHVVLPADDPYHGDGP